MGEGCGVGLSSPLLSFPPSGRGFARSQTPNLKRGAGLHVSDEGHGTWQPQGWESSDAPAWSFSPWGQPRHCAQHPQAAHPLPLCCPRHGPGARGAGLRLQHLELTISNRTESKRRMSGFSARELTWTGSVQVERTEVR